MTRSAPRTPDLEHAADRAPRHSVRARLCESLPVTCPLLAHARPSQGHGNAVSPRVNNHPAPRKPRKQLFFTVAHRPYTCPLCRKTAASAPCFHTQHCQSNFYDRALLVINKRRRKKGRDEQTQESGFNRIKGLSLWKTVLKHYRRGTSAQTLQKPRRRLPLDG